jgi:hypothetical protein
MQLRRLQTLTPPGYGVGAEPPQAFTGDLPGGARRMGYRILAADIRARATDEGYPEGLACQEYRVLLWKDDRWDEAVGLQDC